MGEILIVPKSEVGAPADHEGDKLGYHRPCAMYTAPPVDINERRIQRNPKADMFDTDLNHSCNH